MRARSPLLVLVAFARRVADALAGERPQRRSAERALLRLPARLLSVGLSVEVRTVDLSRTGACVALPAPGPLPRELTFQLPTAGGVRLAARLVWRERVGSELRAGLAFAAPAPGELRTLLRAAVPAEGEPAGAGAARRRPWLAEALELFHRLARGLRPLRTRRRLDPRRRTLRRGALVGTGGGLALVVNACPGGLGLLIVGRGRLRVGEVLPVVGSGVRWARVAHVRRLAPGLSRTGLAFLSERPHAAAEARMYLAA